MTSVWLAKPTDADFRSLRDFGSLSGIGDRTVLARPILGLICSVQCPGSVVLKTFDAVRELRDAGIVVAGGFHSPMEKECLDFLLRGEQPVIVCPAKGLARLRLPASWRKTSEVLKTSEVRPRVWPRRLVLLSPFGDKVKRTTMAQAQIRNEFVAAISRAVLVPHASPGGKAEAIAKHVLERGQPLFTFDDEENASLLKIGARPYDIAEIRGMT